MQEVSQRYGLQVPPDALVQDLPVGVQQRVEIVKALIRDAKVLILDEPTAVLTPQETDDLMEVMRTLKAAGTSIVFITHKLREVRAVADRITVIRRGKVVGEASPDSSAAELASMMVGRPVKLNIEKDPAAPGDEVISAEGVRIVDDAGQVLVDDVSFCRARRGDLRPGRGAGQRPDRADGGAGRTDARSAGQDHARRPRRHEASIDDILAQGVGYVPEDRLHDGLVSSFSVAENLVLDLYDTTPYSNGATST